MEKSHQERTLILDEQEAAQRELGRRMGEINRELGRVMDEITQAARVSTPTRPSTGKAKS